MGYAAICLLLVVAIQAAVIVALWRKSAQHQRAEAAQRESAERLHHIMDTAPIMIWSARPDTTVDYLNRTCTEFTGVPLSKLLNEGWLELVHPDDVNYIKSIYQPAVEKHQGFCMEYRLRRADGDYRWLLTSGTTKFRRDGSFEGMVGCTMDITERREAETRTSESRSALEITQRELRRLAGRLIEAQDAERARLARDLHDDVSQQLAALSITLSAMRHRLQEGATAEDIQLELCLLHERTTKLAQNVRHLSHDFHPTVLRHAGLVPAIMSYCAEVGRSRRPDLICHAEGDFSSLPPDVALCLYRISQEAVRNVIAHAHATRAEVRVIRGETQVDIMITDDGHGFDVPRALDRSSGLGLVSMTERVRLVGGTVEILSETARGTRVFVHVPVRSPTKLAALSKTVSGRPEPTLS